MKKILVAVMCAFAWGNAYAQTPTSLQQFTTWLSQQQAHAGVGYLTKGDKAKYAVTWWDLVQFGQGHYLPNVAQPSIDKDYVDIAPGMALANERAPRYGACVPVHFGNIWNNLPKNVHVNETPLPAFVVGYCILYPNEGGVNLPLNKMQPGKRDGMITFTYGFGGS